MKPSADLFREITKDKDAQSIREIAADVGLSGKTVNDYAMKMVAAGKWRQVWKRGPSGRIVRAFIRTK